MPEQLELLTEEEIDQILQESQPQGVLETVGELAFEATGIPSAVRAGEAIREGRPGRAALELLFAGLGARFTTVPVLRRLLQKFGARRTLEFLNKLRIFGQAPIETSSQKAALKDLEKILTDIGAKGTKALREVETQTAIQEAALKGKTHLLSKAATPQRIKKIDETIKQAIRAREHAIYTLEDQIVDAATRLGGIPLDFMPEEDIIRLFAERTGRIIPESRIEELLKLGKSKASKP